VSGGFDFGGGWWHAASAAPSARTRTLSKFIDSLN